MPSAFAQNFAGHPEARFPKVYRQTTSKNVLTLELFPGREDRPRQGGRLSTGSWWAKRALGVVVKMVFEDGFFHADPHPGKHLRHGAGGGRRCSGSSTSAWSARLSPELRERTVRISWSRPCARIPTPSPTRSIPSVGRSGKSTCASSAPRSACSPRSTSASPLQDIQVSAMIGDLVKAALKFDIEIPSDFMLVGKALMTIEGIGKELDPQLDVFAEAQPLFTDILKRRYSPAPSRQRAAPRSRAAVARRLRPCPCSCARCWTTCASAASGCRRPTPTCRRALDRLGRRVLHRHVRGDDPRERRIFAECAGTSGHRLHLPGGGPIVVVAEPRAPRHAPRLMRVTGSPRYSPGLARVNRSRVARLRRISRPARAGGRPSRRRGSLAACKRHPRQQGSATSTTVDASLDHLDAAAFDASARDAAVFADASLDAGADAADAADASDADAAPIDPDLVAFWTFDEGRRDRWRTDGTSNHYDLTIEKRRHPRGHGLLQRRRAPVPRPHGGRPPASPLSGSGFPPAGTLSIWAYFDSLTSDSSDRGALRLLRREAGTTSTSRYSADNQGGDGNVSLDYATQNGANFDLLRHAPGPSVPLSQWDATSSSSGTPPRATRRPSSTSTAILPAQVADMYTFSNEPLQEDFILTNGFGGMYDRHLLVEAPLQ